MSNCVKEALLLLHSDAPHYSYILKLLLLVYSDAPCYSYILTLPVTYTF